jgi:Fic-DOC domain mobile mystery protein B
VKFEYAPGATPIDRDEAAGLIPTHITLQRDLNEYEEANILEAVEWLFSRRRGDPLDGEFIHAVHRRMFQHVWKWAGTPRCSDKNIGVHWPEIPVRLRQLVGDIRSQIEHKAYAPAEIAARFHHRLVAVHVYPNGNGRHARLMADLLSTDLKGKRFEWGRSSLLQASELRSQYISALRAADAGDYSLLLAFMDILDKS